MIISHKYKYLFVELPHTASTSISSELCQYYDGSKIIRKHAFYHEALKIPVFKRDSYFVFSCIRNPIDQEITIFLRYKNNIKRKDNHERLIRFAKKRTLTKGSLRRYKFIEERDSDFKTYFNRFFILPYSNWSVLDHKRFDFIIRFENVQQDFKKALELIGIKQVRPLPWLNKTKGKNGDFLSYYSPELIDKAKRIFGPFMKEWDYQFPPEWGENSISLKTQIEYHAVNLIRKFWWRHIRWSAHPLGRAIRRLR